MKGNTWGEDSILEARTSKNFLFASYSKNFESQTSAWAEALQAREFHYQSRLKVGAWGSEVKSLI